MNYVAGPLILYSQDKIRMMDFLSDVFEFEVDSEMDTVSSGALNLKLVEHRSEDKEIFQSSGIRFAFKLKNCDQLKEILSKYKFFIYRKENKTHIEEIFMSESDGENTLAIKDIDGRVWQFEVENYQ